VKRNIILAALALSACALPYPKNIEQAAGRSYAACERVTRTPPSWRECQLRAEHECAAAGLPTNCYADEAWRAR